MPGGRRVSASEEFSRILIAVDGNKHPVNCSGGDDSNDATD